MPRQFTNKNEAVYAALEQEGMDVPIQMNDILM